MFPDTGWNVPDITVVDDPRHQFEMSPITSWRYSQRLGLSSIVYRMVSDIAPDTSCRCSQTLVWNVSWDIPINVREHLQIVHGSMSNWCPGLSATDIWGRHQLDIAPDTSCRCSQTLVCMAPETRWTWCQTLVGHVPGHWLECPKH